MTDAIHRGRGPGWTLGAAVGSVSGLVFVLLVGAILWSALGWLSHGLFETLR